MNELTTIAAWILVIAFSLSMGYEFYRATAQRKVSHYDTLANFGKQVLTLYLSAAVVIALLFMGFNWSAWVGLGYCFILILVSIFYYNPQVMMSRQPGIIDWVENVLYGGLLSSAATILIYAITAG